MASCTDSQGVIDNSNICALDADVCPFFVVLGGSDGQEHFISLQVPCGQAALRGRKPSTGSHAEHLKDAVLPSAGLAGSNVRECDVLMRLGRQVCNLFCEQIVIESFLSCMWLVVTVIY